MNNTLKTLAIAAVLAVSTSGAAMARYVCPAGYWYDGYACRYNGPGRVVGSAVTGAGQVAGTAVHAAGNIAGSAVNAAGNVIGAITGQY